VSTLVTGAGGQLGQALASCAPTAGSLTSVTHGQLDIADEAAVGALFRSVRPSLVLNAAAFTRVDDAEKDPAAALRVNEAGVRTLARACSASGAWLVHVSTDYVFDGERNTPYPPDAPVAPLGAYGRSKRAGETALGEELPGRHTLVRTSWLYSGGHRNFVTTMLRLMDGRDELRIVSDQLGAPTHCAGLARALWALGERRAAGVFHWCDSGVASWYDFAVAIAEEAVQARLLNSPPALVPISSAEYPLPAPRPRYSVLDKRTTEELIGMRAPHWRVALRETLRDRARTARDTSS
jgi:dTDP-4-dehydrorhamnose reductase